MLDPFTAQKPEVRAAARQAALAAGKEKKKAAETKKASEKVRHPFAPLYYTKD